METESDANVDSGKDSLSSEASSGETDEDEEEDEDQGAAAIDTETNEVEEENAEETEKEDAHEAANTETNEVDEENAEEANEEEEHEDQRTAPVRETNEIEDEKAEELEEEHDAEEAAAEDEARAPVPCLTPERKPKRTPVLERMSARAGHFLRQRTPHHQKTSNLRQRTRGHQARSPLAPVRVWDPEKQRFRWACPVQGCKHTKTTHTRQATEAHIGQHHTGQFFGPCERCKFRSYNRTSYANHQKRATCERRREKKIVEDRQSLASECADIACEISVKI